MNEEYGNLDNDAELQMAIMMSLAMNKEDQ